MADDEIESDRDATAAQLGCCGERFYFLRTKTKILHIFVLNEAPKEVDG